MLSILQNEKKNNNAQLNCLPPTHSLKLCVSNVQQTLNRNWRSLPSIFNFLKLSFLSFTGDADFSAHVLIVTLKVMAQPHSEMVLPETQCAFQSIIKMQLHLIVTNTIQLSDSSTSGSSCGSQLAIG